MINIIKIVDGDILQASEDILTHQVNCMGVMGGGIAKQIKDKYPNVFKEYTKLLNWAKTEYQRGYSKQEYPLGAVQFVKLEDKKYVANIFGQLRYGRDKQYTDYEALKSGLNGILESVTSEISTLKDYSIAIPYNIGCGLAGGSWDTVYQIIEEVFRDYDVTLYRWEV